VNLRTEVSSFRRMEVKALELNGLGASALLGMDLAGGC